MTEILQISTLSSFKFKCLRIAFYFQWQDVDVKILAKEDKELLLHLTKLWDWNWNTREMSTFPDREDLSWLRLWTWRKLKLRFGFKIAELKINGLKKPIWIISTGIFCRVWKFQDFPVIQILREINFGEFRSSKYAFLLF